MATANKTKGQKEKLITALYCRLSVDDDNKDMESNSITNQKQILQDFARREGYRNTQFFVDDGVSGTTFQREGFQQMQKMVEDGLIGTIIVKDLSRFGREQVEMGRLTQIVYPSFGVTFISIQENVNTAAKTGLEMMPFYNIFNEWYAEQTSKKIRAVWKSKAEHGYLPLFHTATKSRLRTEKSGSLTSLLRRWYEGYSTYALRGVAHHKLPVTLKEKRFSRLRHIMPA